VIERRLATALLAALKDRPVVFLNGARQTGKTTLARAIARGPHPARYLTLDDAGVLAAARADPEGFVAAQQGPVVLDEVQRAPELFLALKASVDRDRRPGRFLLTGSAGVLLLPRLAEALVGRMEVLTLWPLSQGEIAGVRDGFVDAAFQAKPPDLRPERRAGPGLASRIVRGGFPEPLRLTAARRNSWFRSYVSTLLQRDVRELANIEGLTALPVLLDMLAVRASGLLNVADISRTSGLPQTTLKRYLALLDSAFLLQWLPAWHAKLGRRLVKAPKLVLLDSGLAAHLLGLDAQRLARERSLLGQALEGFVVAELRKQVAWSRVQPSLYHFRTHEGLEVDIVMEDAAGRLVGVEVKAGATLGAGDVKGLRALAEATGARFRHGIVLYGGSEVVPFGPRLHALPVDALWRWGASTD
jgi:predicted AAA+ superfamily ATPase